MFLTLLTSVLQHVVRSITYKKDLARIELIVRRARSAAWGPKLVPINGQRKVKINLGEEHDEDGDVVGKKYLNMVVDESGVYLVGSTLRRTFVHSDFLSSLNQTETYTLSTRRALLNRRFSIPGLFHLSK